MQFISTLVIGLFFFVLPQRKTHLYKSYFKTVCPGGAHCFSYKIILSNKKFTEIGYRNSISPGTKAFGIYDIKDDTLMLRFQKHIRRRRKRIFKIKNIFKKIPSAAKRHVRFCASGDTTNFCIEYYLIRKDSLISLYRPKASGKFERSRFFYKKN